MSCTSTGNCVGVGRYLDSSGDVQAMEATETGGTFGQAAEVTAPSDAASDSEPQLFGVSCTRAGNCVGVGNYRDSSLDFQAMEVTETGGTFGQATEVTAPSNAASNTIGVLHELEGCRAPRRATVSVSAASSTPPVSPRGWRRRRPAGPSGRRPR